MQRLVMSRRAVLAGSAGALATRSASADVDPAWRPRELDVREVLVEGTQSRRFVLGVPRHLGRDERAPLLVLLHGLGETGDERTGAWAWFERYGLGTAYDRLRASAPFRGLVLACPFMPDLPIGDPGALDSYARWIVDAVVARARSEAPVIGSPDATYLAGCSLGGHFSLEVLLRRPGTFAAWGGVQTAISEVAGRQYGQRLVGAFRAAPPELLVETSSRDPFRLGNGALSGALTLAAIRHTFVELPGPHDQTWLRSSGTERMLSWFDGLSRP